MVVELDRGGGHGGSSVIDDKLRDGDLERSIDDECDRSALDGLGCERVPVVSIAP